MPDLKRTILYTAEFPASCFVVHCRFSSIWSHEVAGAICPPPPSLTHQATSSTGSALTIDSFDIILKIQVQYVHEAETSLMQTPHHDFSTHARDEKKLRSQMRAPVHPDYCPAAGEIKMVSPASSVILPHLRFPRAPWLPAAKRIRLHLVNKNSKLHSRNPVVGTLDTLNSLVIATLQWILCRREFCFFAWPINH